MFNKNKIKSMSADKYFEVKRTEYVTVQLIPTKSNKNNQTDNIACLINKIHMKFNNVMRIEDKKLIITHRMKVGYYIHITKEEVQFFFILPKVHIIKFKSKFAETWRNIEMKEVESIPIDISTCTKYQLKYKMNDALSLKSDKRNNDLLKANMSVLEILETGESVGVLYNFIPTAEKETNYFKTITYKQAIEKYKNGENLKKTKNIIDLGIISIKFLIDCINELLNTMINSSKNNNSVFLSSNKEISSSTQRKAKNDICKTQIVILSKSYKKDKEKHLAICACNSFKSISDDNELVYKEIKRNINTNLVQIDNVEVNYTTEEECSNFISIPGKDIIDNFKAIEHNKILETKAPKCLENGEIRIGTVKCKDNSQETFYSNDRQIKRLGRILLGPMGAGKDYYMTNLAKDIIDSNRGLIVLDYIDKCQLSDGIKAITPKDKLIEIDCSDINQLQSFAYNELSYNINDDKYSKVSICMQKAQQLELLLNSINDVNSQLTPRMLRYLYAAATVMFYKKINASFKDVIDILKNPSKRDKLINSLDTETISLLSDELEDLEELSKRDKNKPVENADTKIDGILDRISRLKSASLFTRLAFNNDSTDNIDFIKAINEKKVILIKIPEKHFNSKMLRNILATFYLSKVWLAKQQGATESHTEIFVNEIHQSYNCQLLMEDILVECRKFNLTPTLAMHYLGQGTNKLKNSILASGSSYLLLTGCDIKAFQELQVYFQKDGYEESDLTELERYHALCLIKNEETNYSAFVAKLPS